MGDHGLVINLGDEVYGVHKWVTAEESTFKYEFLYYNFAFADKCRDNN